MRETSKQVGSGLFSGVVRKVVVALPILCTVMLLGGCQALVKSKAPPKAQAQADTVNALAINAQSPSTLYAGTDEYGVYESTDGGGSWRAVNNGLTHSRVGALAINPQTPSTLYASAQFGGVFASTDEGASWRAVNKGLTNSSVQAL